jgi:serine/threonine protein kinase
MEIRYVKKLSSVYTFHKKIGEGRYGKVKRATNVVTNRQCACKIVPRDRDYLRELDHLVHLQNIGCKFVLPVKCVTFTSTKMCLEFDLATKSLHKFIKKRQRGSMESLKEVLSEAISITTQLLISVNEMHNAKIIHRDMKPGNIVLFNDTTPWVIDFGMSKRIYSDANLSDVAKYDLVTCYYRAPEMWKREYKKPLHADPMDYSDDVSLHYDSKIDEWSVGCILFEIITGCNAFPGDHEHEIRRSIAGHVFKTTGQKCDFLYSGVIKDYDIEKELNKLICLKYGKQCKRTGKFTINIEDNETVVMFKAVKIFLKRLLQPEPSARASAAELLDCIGYLEEKVEKPIVIKNFKKWNDPTMMKVLDIVNEAIHICSFLKISPKLAYFAIYLFLSVFSKATDEFKIKFGVENMLHACFKITISYHTDYYDKVHQMEKYLPYKLDWQEQIECVNGVLCITNGQIWVENPGDRRREIFPLIDVEKWNDDTEKQIFDAVLLLVLADSGPPDVELVYELVECRKSIKE